MSENLDLVRSIFADWERGDFTNGAWADPDIKFVIREGVQAGKWTGIAAMAKAFYDVLGAWDEYQAQAQAFRQVSNERVLVLTRTHGRIKLSTAEVAERGAAVFDIRGGRVTSLTLYNNHDRALADLGLAE